MDIVTPDLVVIGLVLVLALILALLLARRAAGRNRVLPEENAVRAKAGYDCPECGHAMEPGYLLLGRGAVWAPRSSYRQRGSQPTGMPVANTLNMSPRPALNLAWRCGQCELLLLDHHQLVRPRRSG